MADTIQPTIIRRASERGQTKLSWLDSRHTFSFGEYHDPAHMGYRSLRVINDDRVAARAGFGEHPHRDMEILTWPLSGRLAHRDSTHGQEQIIEPGTLQAMTAGSGIRHSEFNPDDGPAHFLQIWLLPEANGLEPGYRQRSFSKVARHDRWCVIAAGEPREEALLVHQDVVVAAALLSAGASLPLEVSQGRHTWLHVASGEVTAAGESLSEGDAIAQDGPATITLVAENDAELLAFDLA